MRLFLLISILVNLNFTKASVAAEPTSPYIIVLGVAQDGGYPQMGCTKICCTQAWENPSLKRNVVSLALIDPIQKKWWLFEATPDLKNQLHNLQSQTEGKYPYLPEGVFISHAHIGHYTGLMQFGREVMNTNQIKVYVLPKLKYFIENNGPWSQLVKLNNIALVPLSEDATLTISNINITPFTVPHRDEFSETAGFKIQTLKKRYLFIPDIDKWDKWNKKIVDEIKNTDIAFLDATFYSPTELGNRPMAEVPHPLVQETVSLLEKENATVKSKVFFLHFNHTNPLLWDKKIQNTIHSSGFNIAKEGQIFY